MPRKKQVKTKETKEPKSGIDNVLSKKQDPDYIFSDEYYENIERVRGKDGRQLKLNVPEQYKDPQLEYRWVKGESARLIEMQNKGWNFVEDSELAKKYKSGDSKVSIVTGKLDNGLERRDYLMCMPKKWYKKFQENKDAHLKKLDEQIESGNMDNRNEEDRTYYDIIVGTRRNKKDI